MSHPLPMTWTFFANYYDLATKRWEIEKKLQKIISSENVCSIKLNFTERILVVVHLNDAYHGNWLRSSPAMQFKVASDL